MYLQINMNDFLFVTDFHNETLKIENNFITTNHETGME